MTKLDVLGVTKHRAVLYLEHTGHGILLGSVLTGLTGGSNVKCHSFLKHLTSKFCLFMVTLFLIHALTPIKWGMSVYLS